MEILSALGVRDFEAKQDLNYELKGDVTLNLYANYDDYPGPWIGFGIGGSGSFKRWPHYPELAKMLPGTIFVFGSGDSDEELSKRIEGQNVVNLVNRLSIRETSLAIGRCDIMICNDSFHMHCAATYGIPIVEIIGEPPGGNLGDQHLPAQFGPWGSEFVWVQPDSGGIENVTVDEVLQSMQQLKKWMI
jgi:ADP-heptose:LPS heptosyltransferase